MWLGGARVPGARSPQHHEYSVWLGAQPSTTVGDVHDDTAVNAVVDVGVAPLLFFLPLPIPCPAAFSCGSACPPAALPPAVFLPDFFFCIFSYSSGASFLFFSSMTAC